MNHWYQEDRLLKDHQKEIHEYVENERLAKAAGAGRRLRPSWTDRILARLGDRLERTGQRLKESHTLAADSGHRRESRSSVT